MAQLAQRGQWAIQALQDRLGQLAILVQPERLPLASPTKGLSQRLAIFPVLATSMATHTLLTLMNIFMFGMGLSGLMLDRSLQAP